MGRKLRVGARKKKERKRKRKEEEEKGKAGKGRWGKGKERQVSLPAQWSMANGGGHHIAKQIDMA